MPNYWDNFSPLYAQQHAQMAQENALAGQGRLQGQQLDAQQQQEMLRLQSARERAQEQMRMQLMQLQSHEAMAKAELASKSGLQSQLLQSHEGQAALDRALKEKQFREEKKPGMMETLGAKIAIAGKPLAEQGALLNNLNEITQAHNAPINTNPQAPGGKPSPPGDVLNTTLGIRDLLGLPRNEAVPSGYDIPKEGPDFRTMVPKINSPVGQGILNDPAKSAEFIKTYQNAFPGYAAQNKLADFINLKKISSGHGTVGDIFKNNPFNFPHRWTGQEELDSRYQEGETGKKLRDMLYPQQQPAE